jgi:hypothetical protein
LRFYFVFREMLDPDKISACLLHHEEGDNGRALVDDQLPLAGPQRGRRPEGQAHLRAVRGDNERENRRASGTLSEADVAFVGIAIISICGFGFSFTVRLLERILAPWKRKASRPFPSS